jgi:hypothetical protein
LEACGSTICRADGAVQSGGGPPQSKTPARSPIISCRREAFWTKPVLWRFIWHEALAKDLKAAQAAYVAVGKIHFDGAHFRRDTGARAL